MDTDQRANRHPHKSADYTEEAQNVRDDDLGSNAKPLTDRDNSHARHKANESKQNEDSRG